MKGQITSSSSLRFCSSMILLSQSCLAFIFFSSSSRCLLCSASRSAFLIPDLIDMFLSRSCFFYSRIISLFSWVSLQSYSFFKLPLRCVVSVLRPGGQFPVVDVLFQALFKHLVLLGLHHQLLFMSSLVLRLAYLLTSSFSWAVLAFLSLSFMISWARFFVSSIFFYA